MRSLSVSDVYAADVHRSVLCLALLSSFGCAPTYHTAEAYRFDPVATAALEQLAAHICAERGEPGGKPTERFRTDGCSMWPDGTFAGETWQSC